MPEAVVIGAGPGGLAAAAMIQREGVDTVVVDRADAVGSAWRNHYERLHLHTVRWLSHLPGFKIPREFGKWVARDDVVRYLEQYAAHHRLNIVFGTEITRIDRERGHDRGDQPGDPAGASDAEPGRWVLRSPQGDIEARYVVVANGHNHTPDLPDWPGAASFTGELLHASRYRNATAYVGKDVLVVGSGNTGAEIALDLIETGAASVKVAIRTPPHIVFREQGAIVNPMLGVAFRHLPPRLFDPIAKRLRTLTLGDLSEYGLPMPKDGLYERVLRDDSIPLVDMGFLDAVKAGQVSIVAAVSGFDGAKVLLADGTVLAVDAVIAATGYRRGLEPLVGHLGVLGADGRPKRRGPVTDPAAPNLWFTGFTNPVSGMFRELGLDAKRIGRSVARQHSRGRRRELSSR